MLAEKTNNALNRVFDTYRQEQALRPESNGCKTGQGCDHCQNRCAGDTATSLGDLEDLIPVFQEKCIMLRNITNTITVNSNNPIIVINTTKSI